MKKLTHEEFVVRANEKHGGKYQYPTRYEGRKVKIPIFCPEVGHGLFPQRADAHIAGRGCPICNDVTLTHDQFLEKARAIYGDKYEYPEPYISRRADMNINCPMHGLFLQNTNCHLDGK